MNCILNEGEAFAYVTTQTGFRLPNRMINFGKYWRADTGEYEDKHQDTKAPAIPETLLDLANKCMGIAKRKYMTITAMVPDVCTII
jgi:hypothetical protein